MESLILRQFIEASTLVEKPLAVTYAEMVCSTSTHSLGGGLWSIELHSGYDDYSECLAEFVGSNGTRYDEEADDLWQEVDEWMYSKGLEVHHWTPAKFLTPDGTVLTKKQFLAEVEEGRLHGIILKF